ncbi:MAG TPA: NAD(P)-dependent alcohol dehydrogenase [Vicinamibacterales bacterium]|nr:NAD(P)-dependent alcohol dehydrogenase [Vicinamibacterales bacterium]
MRAIVYSDYGGPQVLQLTDVQTPTPQPNEILVKVHAAALNPVDWHFVRGAPYPLRMAAGGLRRPNRHRRVGCDYSGTIEAVGRSVTEFTAGEAVFGLGDGTLAQYLAVQADRVVRKPERLTFEQAASVPLAGLTALQMLRDKALVRSGHEVLIVGAAGGIGTLAVQIAKSFGAHVTGVQSTGALDLVRSIGADRVIDYTKEDFTAGEERYDVIIDNVCNRPLADVLRVLKRNGTLVPNGGGSPDKGISILGLVRMLAMGPFISQTIKMFVTTPNRADLQFLADLIQAGTVSPVIDTCYPLTAAADAFRHLESGHAHGKIVVSIAPA